MSRNMVRASYLLGVLITLTSAQVANAQWGCPTPCPTVCPCPRPVLQTCYRTVPVTEYRKVRQTVMKPVYSTKYVDQKVTAYRPETETRTANVPTVSYHNVTECRTVTKNCGYWRTRYQQRCQIAPCQYDRRPGLLGWLNRTGYSIRSTFTPKTIAHREYVPRTVAYNVPSTRRVAHHGTRKVAYKVTRMVPYTTTRRVAVRTMKMVAHNVVHNQPVTVWRTIPVGSRLAYANGLTTTALAPVPDPVSATARRDSKERTASRKDDKFSDRSSDGTDGRFQRETPKTLKKTGGEKPIKTPFTSNHPLKKSRLEGWVLAPKSQQTKIASAEKPATNGWIATHEPAAAPMISGPRLIGPNTVAQLSE